MKLDIDPKRFKVTVYRTEGYSAVRIIDQKTGIEATHDKRKSVTKNRQIAYLELLEKIEEKTGERVS